jgi:protein subunit release factor A
MSGFIGTPSMADVEELKARLDKLEAKVFPPEPPPSLVRDQDVRVDIYRSDRLAPMTLRLTHIPTGIVVTVEGEKSQLQNKAKALEELEAKLAEREWMS